MEAAFFDLDKTVISKSSSLALTRPMYRAGLVSRSSLLKSVYAQLVYLLLGADEKKMDRLKESMLALTRGWERDQVDGIIREALSDLDPYIYLEALDLMELHRALGRKVFLVSSAVEDVVRPLAERLGEVEVIATRVKIEDGRYTGELDFYCFRENKAVAIREIAEREGIDLAGSYAYSDSATDTPMLEAVGHPVAVNPDRELRREAEKRGWQIRDFRRPVRLRQRLPQVPAPSPGAVAVAASAVVRMPDPDDPAVARLDRAVERLHGLVSGALDGRGRLTPGVETELLAIVGELTVGLIPEAADRAERLATRLAQ